MNVCLKAARAPETPKTKLKCGPRAQISSDCLRKSLDFEIGVGYRLGALRMSDKACPRCCLDAEPTKPGRKLGGPERLGLRNLTGAGRRPIGRADSNGHPA